MKQLGITLIELMITLALLATVVAIGLPAMGDLVRNTRITTVVNDLIAATTVARSEAMKRRASVTLCASDNALDASPACDKGAGTVWENGWVVFVDTDGDAVIDAGEALLQRQGSLAGTLAIRADAAVAEYISFSSAGRTRSTGGASVTGDLVICDDRGIVASGGGSAARGLNISRTGRTQAIRDQTAVAGLGISCP